MYYKISIMLAEGLRVLTSKKIGKSTKNAIYKDGFFFSVGLFLGIGLNDLWRISRSELNYQKLAVAGKDNPFIEEVHMDEIYQYVMVAGALAISAITGKHFNEALPASAGAFTGIAWSNHMERKGAAPISIIPV